MENIITNTQQKPMPRWRIHEMEVFFNLQKKSNKKKNKEGSSKYLETHVHALSLYFYLFFALKEDIKEKTPSRLFYLRSYLVPIINNFEVIKMLYYRGFHTQIQFILRTQIEYVNTLVTFMMDEDFFRRFTATQEQSLTRSTTITPKMVHTDRVLRKIMPKDLLDLYIGYRDYLYSDFSEISHGNIARLSIQSMNMNEKKGTATAGLGGVCFTSDFTNATIDNASLYFQLAFKIIMEKAIAYKYIKKDVEWIDHLHYHKSRLMHRQL